MEILTNDVKLHDELLLVAKLFFKLDDDIIINHEITVKGRSVINSVWLKNDEKHIKINVLPNIMRKNKKYKYFKRFSKLCLYEFLSILCDKKLPWGSLTGIRPTKLFYELLAESNSDYELAKNRLINEFYVSEQKAEVVKQIALNQNLPAKNDKLVHLYINIPFCPTRCSYCSFISGGIKECGKYIEPYVKTLKYEIHETLKMLSKKKYVISTIYIGGGTPTSLTAEQIDDILSELDSLDVKEFTVESGRPDTISKDKLDVLKKHGVTRICINPQTFSDETLNLIGRNHTSKEVVDAFKLAKNYDFIINSDLIAGLEKEDLKTFKNSLNKTLKLAPQNITVHTLSIKKASILIEQNKKQTDENIVEQMIDYSFKILTENGYKPYYLYKQKNMVGNLENIGYYKDNTACLFNIVSMEEVASIVACGANAISKRYLAKQDKIERWANVKNLNDYINRIDEMIAKKNALFEKRK